MSTEWTRSSPCDQCLPVVELSWLSGLISETSLYSVPDMFYYFVFKAGERGLPQTYYTHSYVHYISYVRRVKLSICGGRHAEITCADMLIYKGNE